MPSQSELLVIYGFVKDSARDKYEGKTPEERKKFIDSLKQKKGSSEVEKQLEGDAQNDVLEITKNQLITVDYPSPISKYQAVYESLNQSIEPIYFWALNTLTNDLGFPWVEKLTDVFTASEHSSFYGAAAQRLGLTQDKVQSYLALIGQFIRNDLFQLVRDIRWIDERLKYHVESRFFTDKKEKKFESAEITLKGIWTDLVDGVVQGQRVSGNVFQMAQQLQFTTLPTFFFACHPKDTSEIDAVVDNIPTTKDVKSVLKRKLEQYVVWRDYNYKELSQRRKFETKYLRQHYNIIKMYLTWLKPYMKAAERLRGDINKLSKPELISAFEGSLVNIEILASKIPEKNKDVFSCILLTFDYRTRPSMDYTDQTRYHRGPLHVGETKITWRSYAWNREQIQNFIAMKERNDFESLGDIDNSIRSVIDAIGEDLWKFLKEAEEETPALESEIAELAGKTGLSRTEVERILRRKEETKKPKKETLISPFVDVYKGFGDMFKAFKSQGLGIKDKPNKADSEKKAKEKDAAQKDAKKSLWIHYKVFKKVHGFPAW